MKYFLPFLTAVLFSITPSGLSETTEKVRWLKETVTTVDSAASTATTTRLELVTGDPSNPASFKLLSENTVTVQKEKPTPEPEPELIENVYDKSDQLILAAIERGGEKKLLDGNGWNSKHWLSAYDFSGMSIWNNQGRTQRAGTAITKLHVIVAQHFPIDIDKTLMFRAKDGTTVLRKVVSKKRLGADIAVLKLNASLPENIKVYRLLDAGDPKILKTRSFVATDQENKAFVLKWTKRYNATHGVVFAWPADATLNKLAELTVKGDSGRPLFILTEQQLIFASHFTSYNSGPHYGGMREALDAAVAPEKITWFPE